MKINPFETYYLEVITKDYPSILKFGEKYEIKGYDIPKYINEHDVKFISQEEFKSKKEVQNTENTEFIDFEALPKFSLYLNGIKNIKPNKDINLIDFLELLHQDNPLIEQLRKE